MKNTYINALLTVILLSVLIVSFTSSTHSSTLNILNPILPTEEAKLDSLYTADEDISPISVQIPAEENPESNFQILYKENPYAELLKKNEDFMGWINIPGTMIDTLFVKGNDNDYYLRRDFNKRYAINGTVFMDHRNIGFGFSRNVILYGHNMRDGSMFGDLDKYKTPGFALDNTLIEIRDLYGLRYYRIYSSYFSEADSSLVVISPGDDNWAFHIEDQIERSMVDYGLTPDINASFLTLVTCSYEVDNGRFFIHAVEVPTSLSLSDK